MVLRTIAKTGLAIFQKENATIAKIAHIILMKGKEMTNEQFEERAAIMEYDGNLIREEAERLAREDELRQIQEKNNQSA